MPEFTTTTQRPNLPKQAVGPRPKPKQKKERGFFRKVLGFLSGLVWLVLATSLFFGGLVVASYFVIGSFIRGQEVEAPNLTARPVTEALQVAKQLNLSLEFEREEASDALGPGEVLSQTPKPGSKIKSRTPIRVVVSSGRRLVTLSEKLVGEPRLQAGIDLHELGLELGNVATVPASGTNTDVVLALDPPAGTGVPPGSAVNLLVSSDAGARTFVMPDLFGLTAEQANAELARFGISAKRVREEESGSAAKGKVYSQKPEPGTPITGESQIEITIEPK